jgi:hypothetical protein
MDLADLDNRFSYHPPKDQAMVDTYQKIRDEAKNLVITMSTLCPESRELSLAVTNIEQAVFWANASIARNS